MSLTSIAHIRHAATGDVIQSVHDHDLQTARYAAAVLPQVFRRAGYYAGLIHDLGKCKLEFGLYITGATPSAEVDHSSIALAYILDKHHGSKDPAEMLLSEVIAFAVGAHHGLFDCDLDGEPVNIFMKRYAKKTAIHYDEAVDNFFKECFTEKYLEQKWQEALKDFRVFFDKLRQLALTAKPGDLDFLIGAAARMILSALMEGDSRDTAEFMRGGKYKPRRTGKKEWERRLKHIDKAVGKLPSTTVIDRSRAQISQKCRDFGIVKPPDIYRLNTPAGAGKTISGARYAAAHAKTYGKKRLIFSAPLLGIIDQNAPIIRNVIGGTERTVAECHSNVMRNGSDPEVTYELESWHSPVIVTTMFQVLMSFFGGRKSQVRRLQAFSNAVVVMDEVHTIPAKMLSMFNLMLIFLSEFCETTIVLCSATQPALEKADHPLPKMPEDIIPYDPALWAAFTRTDITAQPHEMSLKGVVTEAEKLLTTYDSILIVCNLKQEASDLYTEMKKKHKYVYHLSAAMCMDHRRRTLRRMTSAFGKGKVICVATQVIEAGIDISFDAGIRVLAGMDNVVQTAGRVNRNGLAAYPAPVEIIRMAGEQKSLYSLEDIRKAQDATLTLLNNFKYNPAIYSYSLVSDAAIDCFWKDLYRRNKGQQDYQTTFCMTPLFELLSENKPCRKRTKDDFVMHQSFKLAADLFKVFDDNNQSVVVPYGGGKAIIRDLQSPRAMTDKAFLIKKLRQARKYSVNVFDNQIKKLLALGVLKPVCNDMALILTDPAYYNKDTGVVRVD